MEMLVRPGFGLNEGRFTSLVRSDQAMQLIAVDDIGKFVAAIFAKRPRFGGKTLKIASDTVTGRELKAAFTEAAGHPISYTRFPDEVLAASPDLAQIAASLADGLLADHADLNVMREINPELLSFRSWLTGSGRKAFRAAYPDIRLEFVIDDSITDVIAKGFDFGIRSGAIVQQDMISVPLTPDLRMAVVASPTYFAQRSPLRTPAELSGHACLTYRWYETGALHPWCFDDPEGPVDVIVDSVMTANDTDLLFDGALRGCGVALLVESLVEKHIADGSLQRVLTDWYKPFPGFHLYYPSRRHMPAAMRTFIDWMRLS